MISAIGVSIIVALLVGTDFSSGDPGHREGDQALEADPRTSEARPPRRSGGMSVPPYALPAPSAEDFVQGLRGLRLMDPRKLEELRARFPRNPLIPYRNATAPRKEGGRLPPRAKLLTEINDLYLRIVSKMATKSEVNRYFDHLVEYERDRLQLAPYEVSHVQPEQDKDPLPRRPEAEEGRIVEAIGIARALALEAAEGNGEHE